jgi:Ca-activated chloride channel family protein
MSFDRPLFLAVLLLAPVAVAVYLVVQRRRRRYAVSFTNLDVLRRVTERRRSWRSHLPSALGLLVLASLVVAAAGPHVTRTTSIERATVVLAIDTSRSMRAEDIRPSRLAAAATAAHAFLAEVPHRLRVGIVLFAGDVQVAAVPTTDRDVLAASIDAIGISDVPGTAIGDALARSVELGQDALRDPEGGSGVTEPPPDVAGVVSILFLSDGRQYLGNIQPEEGTAHALAAGIPVHTVLLGTRDGGAQGFGGSGAFGGQFLAADPETLRSIATATGGQFFEAASQEALTGAYADLGSRLGRAPSEVEVTVLFVAAAVLALLVASSLSAAWWPRLP